jgi:ribose/xylose/arabinose/galactoside ABC-type transport system permease subunit
VNDKNLKTNVAFETAKRYLLMIGLVVVIIVLFTSMQPAFFSVMNLRNTIIDIALPVIVAAGMMIVIAGGGLDMSIGPICGFASLLSSLFMVNAGLPIAVSVAIGIAAGTGIGAINGLMVSRAGIDSFIATLGMQFVLLGIRYWLTGGKTISRLPQEFLAAGRGDLIGIPKLTIFMIVIVVIFIFVIDYTIFGRRLTSLGMNIEATRLSGINVKNMTLSAFALSGLLSSVCGVLLAAKTSTVTVDSGDSYTLDALTIAVFSYSIFGRAKPIGLVIAAVIIVLLTNGFSMIGASPSWINMIKGVIMLAAIIVGRIINKK